MSYHAILDDAGQTGGDIASNNGWARFAEWARTQTSATELRTLVDHGQSENLGALRTDIRRALRKNPGDSEKSIAAGLLALLAKAGDAKVITISDGC